MVAPISVVGILYYPDCQLGTRTILVCSYDFKLAGFAAWVLGPIGVLLPLAAGLAWVFRAPTSKRDA